MILKVNRFSIWLLFFDIVLNSDRQGLCFGSFSFVHPARHTYIKSNPSALLLHIDLLYKNTCSVTWGAYRTGVHGTHQKYYCFVSISRIISVCPPSPAYWVHIIRTPPPYAPNRIFHIDLLCSDLCSVTDGCIMYWGHKRKRSDCYTMSKQRCLNFRS